MLLRIIFLKNTKLHRKRDGRCLLNPPISLLVLLLSFSSRSSLQSLGRLTAEWYSFASLPWCSAVASWNKLSIQCPQEKKPYFICTQNSTNGHLSKQPIFLARSSPYIDTCLNLSTTATFFCPQGGRWGAAQLYLFLSEVSQLPPPLPGRGSGGEFTNGKFGWGLYCALPNPV